MEDKEFTYQVLHRHQVINALIQANEYKSYLEVGVQNGICFNEVICERKVGVDPAPFSKATVFQTSDDFFAENKEQFDIIFLDGLHTAEQVYKDILNAIMALAPRGTIVVHDCNPLSEEAQKVPRMQAVWNGDVWKTWVKLRTKRADLEMCVLDTDHGCGIIKRGAQELIIINDELTYENLNNNRAEWLNLVTSIDLRYDD